MRVRDKKNRESEQKCRESVESEADSPEGMEAKDDGRTIADMSDVPQGLLSGGWRPLGVSGAGHREHRPGGTYESGNPKRPWENSTMSWKERWMYALGALKAALLIGLAYIVGLGLLIALMVLVWK